MGWRDEPTLFCLLFYFLLHSFSFRTPPSSLSTQRESQKKENYQSSRARCSRFYRLTYNNCLEGKHVHCKHVWFQGDLFYYHPPLAGTIPYKCSRSLKSEVSSVTVRKFQSMIPFKKMCPLGLCLFLLTISTAFHFGIQCT